MDRYKFRLYDKKNKVMYYPGDRPFYITPWGQPVYNECLLVDFEVMQYTGLKDKNGKEIYEGDIVWYERWGRRYTVVFESGMFKAQYSKEFMNISLCTLVGESICEVIGNIHDNPELVEVQRETT